VLWGTGNIRWMSGAVTSVTFERDERRHAVIEWTVTGSCDQVDIAWVSGPDSEEASPARTVSARAGATVIDDAPAGLGYVSVRPSGGGQAVIAGERNLGLRGPCNFRDLGGYRGAGGARVRWGRVFRSDTLALEDEDLEVFAALGIRAVYDLRSDRERETSPNRLPEGAGVVELVALISQDSSPPSLETLQVDGESFLAGIYLHMLERSAVGFGRILTGLADGGRLPAVFHCAAGKDRTGMVAALLLSVLGVDESDVLDDYELTSRYRRPEKIAATKARLEGEYSVPAEVVAGILRTPRWAMESTLAELHERYGSVEGYLTGPAAVDPSVPETLRRLLLR
jgi:protein-tyrosine phosphatase